MYKTVSCASRLTIPRYDNVNSVVRTPSTQATAASETSSPIRIAESRKYCQRKRNLPKINQLHIK